ncbi:MAG: glycoside hydrolase family 38 C-terminal domain-containing protein, partial [Eubacteriales bacterium]|nr:glycoside hydrolase family 38 C-terminal domain-containing protein [Eubacteriales bacterium]
MKKKIYMIGNAHLDPVWMWQWQEGCAEVKATFRSALDRMNEFPDFKFTCAAAVTYAWIEDICPEMFDEIKQRISEGRWIIAGGWWVQPDCNLPSGESFVRQALYSQRFFNDKFGVTAKVGYNVDSFGHNQSIPQFLKKSGMDYYIFMRPGEHEKHLESNVFVWQSPDGTSVPAFRIPFTYCCNFSSKEELKQHISNVCDASDKYIDAAMCFYGVGNHGGGPTKKNLEYIEELKKDESVNGVDILYGDPYDYFERHIKDNTALNVINDDLQHHASGCYSAVSQIKTANRFSENRLISAEKYSVMALMLADKDYPGDKLKTGWENTLFNQFHDALGGCSIFPVYTDAVEFEGEALSIAAKNENSALQRLSWLIDTSDSEYVPVVVFNPLTWGVKAQIRVNKYLTNITDEEGLTVPCQNIRSETQSCYGREDTLFTADLPPLGWRLYKGYIKKESELSEKNRNTVHTDGKKIENSFLSVKFEQHTGYIESIYDKKTQRELLSGMGAVPVVIDEYYHDTWSHAKNYFDQNIAQFSDAEITVIENGPVRATVKIVNRYNLSVLTQYFSLSENSNKLEIKSEIDWHEKHKMLKLSYPINTINPRAFYEIPYAHIERPCDGEEECGLRWVAVKGSEYGMAMLNNNKYSFSIKDNTLNLTVVRSPIYGDHGNTRSAESPFTDQGAHKFEYTLLPL